MDEDVDGRGERGRGWGEVGWVVSDEGDELGHGPHAGGEAEGCGVGVCWWGRVLDREV